MKYVIGNWKMNGDAAKLAAFRGTLSDRAFLCVPFHLLSAGLGAQDCSAFPEGPRTGEVSAKMIAAAGARACIVGHSERRRNFAETNEIVAEKAARCLEAGLVPIICVGETDKGAPLSIVESQVWQSVPKADSIKGGIIVAYEPVWAIGTGLVPTPADIEKVHAAIAKILETLGLSGTAILYGGSVTAANAAEIMALKNVGGVLVGGASLDLNQFTEIINAGK